MKQIPINYYPLHRSGCSLEKDTSIDYYRGHHKRIYGPILFINLTKIPLLCDFEGMPEIGSQFQLFRVDNEVDYNSFYSLN